MMTIPSSSAVMQFLSNGLSHHVGQRHPLRSIPQRMVDQRLIVTPSHFCSGLEKSQDVVVQSHRHARLPTMLGLQSSQAGTADTGLASPKSIVA